MDRTDQERFIRELMGNVQKTLLGNLDKIPQEWDGIELRWWMAYEFCQACPDRRRPGRRKRFADLRNHINTTGGL